ncbi:hypothetical protein C8R43DRAFT_943409 [Mycena crocata]|nr:hypothetical protein C8R43DRAFT_943409 [Mycena crocata]
MPVSITAAHDAETVHVTNDASWRAFPPGHPAAHYPPEMQAFIYGPLSRSPSPAPTALHSSPPHHASWYRDDDDVPAILTVHATPVPSPRDFSALRGTASTHPWRTIRRRNHRLLPQREAPRPFPKSQPKRTIISAPRADILTVHDHAPIRPPTPTPLAPIQATSLFGLDNPIPVLALPLPITLPWDPYRFIPSHFPVLEHSLPGQTWYGPVQSGLALVCARKYPWIAVARNDIADVVWGTPPYYEFDERIDILDLLPPDQFVFLMVLVQICHLEPDFAGFVEPAITDFVNAWLTHCCSFG